MVESYFSTLKLELSLDDNCECLISPQQLQRDLAFLIEGYYNRERRHSTIGYMSPIDYEQAFTTDCRLTPVNPRSCPRNRENPSLSLAIRMGRHCNSTDVVAMPDERICVIAAPTFIRSENVTELIAQALRDWCKATDTTNKGDI